MFSTDNMLKLCDRGQDYRTKEYKFLSSEAEHRFDSIVNRKTPGIIYWDLFRYLKEDIPEEMSGVDLETRSKYHPKMLEVPLAKYLSNGHLGNCDQGALREATSRVARMFYCGMLEPLDDSEVIVQLGKNAGAPTFISKGDAMHQAIDERSSIRNGKCPPPIAVFHRGKNKDVVRPVFAYPLAVGLLEYRFFLPWQMEMLRHHTPYVGGAKPAYVSGLINEMRWNSNATLELDYSGFDGSLCANLISKAFWIIETSFNMEDSDKRDWEIIKKYFLTGPFLLPDKKLLFGRRHGVPSGSVFTQAIDSICNCIAVEYLKIRTGMMTSRYYVMGDDSLIGIIGKAPNLEVLSTHAEELGLELNTKKSAIKKVAEGVEPYFLGHVYNSYFLSRPSQETIERLLCPEKIDVRFFKRKSGSGGMKDFKVAQIERLKAYQNDNESAFWLLQRQINRLRFSNPNRKLLMSDFSHGNTELEREQFVFNPMYGILIDWDSGGSLNRATIGF